MKIIVMILSVLTFPFYCGAYILAYALHMKNREDMPTLTEWLNLYKEVENYE